MRPAPVLAAPVVAAVLAVGAVSGGCASAPGEPEVRPGSAAPSPADPSPGAPPASSSPPTAGGSGSPEPSTTTPADGATVRRIGPRLEARMSASHRAGCPVPLADLRHLRLPYVGFDGETHAGELVVHEDVADDVVTVFRRLHEARFPVRRMRLVDVYAGDDDRSMAADNTSAYNCRRVAGTDRWSEHAYGRAIDVNPRENPYVRGGSVAPPAGAEYADVDRSPGARVRPGVITAGDVVVTAFGDIGWGWGGTWTGSKDYQHFSASGR